MTKFYVDYNKSASASIINWDSDINIDVCEPFIDFIRCDDGEAFQFLNSIDNDFKTIMVWYSMHQILEYEVTRNIIIGILLCVCVSSCCFCLCKMRRRELKKKVRISPRETVYVNPLRIKDEKILRIL